MVLFDKATYDKERNVMVYEINKYTLEDMGEEERKTGMADVYVFRLMEKYPERKDELRKIYQYVDKLKNSCFENAEELLMLYGMDKILRMLNEAFIDE